jgi:hypothetical protein
MGKGLKGTINNINIANNEIEQEFLNDIANNCLNLRNLIIKLPQTHQHVSSNNLVSTTTIDKLCTIIQKQNNLKIFKITKGHLLNNILLSLEFQKHSIVQIEFTKTDFINVNLNSLKNLYNLKYLTFHFCKGILLDQCEVLNFVSFKLEELSFRRNVWNGDVTTIMIKYLGASLKRLIVENLTIPLIENISMYCSNLVFLKIIINFRNIDLSMLPFFKNLRTNILNITISFPYSNYINEFFINLASNIPINISKITIYLLNSSNTILLFKEFLENCHNNFEIIGINHIIELEFLKIILNYIKRSDNKLKILGMKLNKELNYEESILLDQIKVKGIKIVDFYSFYNNYYV